jgi:hypothetical protein
LVASLGKLSWKSIDILKKWEEVQEARVMVVFSMSADENSKFHV